MNAAPNDLFANYTMMIHALEYVNRPEIIEGVFNEFKNEDVNFSNCDVCVWRYYAQARAYVSLDELISAENLILPILSQTTLREPREIAVRIFVPYFFICLTSDLRFHSRSVHP